MIDLNFWTLVHFSALLGLGLYGLHRVWILYHWFMGKKSAALDSVSISAIVDADAPWVTVQLPLYNERFVAERLLDATAMMDWPKDKLEIQVLDDSTDDTGLIVEKRATLWRSKGIPIKVIRRTNRTGYKAGALGHGMSVAKGEFFAIFDADFIPPPNFLLRTIPHFKDEKIGMVQARWGFLNAEHSWLTSIQGLLLGPHFSFEHWVRYRRGLFFNFNGTAGVWRRTAIESAGGWRADTVTEDLDLSYRAQLEGWRFKYLEEVVVPSELPVTMASFRSQQQRWAKGSVQTARKFLPRILMSRLPLAVKMEAAAHLLANVCWLLGFIVTLTLYPTIISRTGIGPYHILRVDVPFFLFTSFAIFMYFAFYRSSQQGRISLWALIIMPVFTIGLAPGIMLSVIGGMFTKGGVFHRTAKFGISGHSEFPVLSFLYRQASLKYIVMNALLFAYMLLPIFFAIERKTWLAIPFLSLFALGFLMVTVLDTGEFLSHVRRVLLHDYRAKRRQARDVSESVVSDGA